MTRPEDDPVFQRGFANRKAVVGAEHVARSWAAADDFNRPMQELVTRYCWGEVWGNEDLPFKTRSLLNIAMLTTLNRPHELKLHVQGALRNGCTQAEIRAVLMQTAIYVGVPAALDAFRVAADAIQTFEG
jgi:4-carboxymuconolactone decarboxylase